MKKWNKKEVDQEIVKNLCKDYALDALTATILARRGITNGSDILFFKETDTRFLHNPFLFSNMEDAVDRILDAKEEGEKILIFGDRDVDGISATAILYTYLKRHDYDVTWQIPIGEESYGLSMEAIDKFAEEYGSLIITVDCGISNVQEVAHAAELGIDVIVTDHHNPPEILPAAYTIIDPKTENSGYPFVDISGAVVALKLVNALRFSESDLYKQEFTLLDVSKTASGYTLECIKLKNLVANDELIENFTEEGESITKTKLPTFLLGQQIIVWDKEKIEGMLRNIFGSGVDFSLLDFRKTMLSHNPNFSNMSLSSLKEKSRIIKYSKKNTREIDAFFNLFVSYMEKQIRSEENILKEQDDLQLACLASLADCMPLKNENKIIVKAGLNLFRNAKIRKGIAELFSRLVISGKYITASDLSWTAIPSLNAAGRIGKANIALSLLVSENAEEREKLSEEIIKMNERRKDFVASALSIIGNKAEESFIQSGKKLCLVIDERINKGVTGIVAAKLMTKYNVPAIVVTQTEENIAAGSMRSCRGCKATEFLDKFTNTFINHGGHNFAAGFSLQKEKLQDFKNDCIKFSSDIILEQDDNALFIDAELPHNYLRPEILNLVDFFEPTGEENAELLFFSKALPVKEAMRIGKNEVQHLKILFDCGTYKFPAIFWNEGDKLDKAFSVGDKLDAIFSINRNIFNGNVTPQLILTDIQKV